MSQQDEFFSPSSDEDHTATGRDVANFPASHFWTDAINAKQ
jgi:hypothetical protein